MYVILDAVDIFMPNDPVATSGSSLRDSSKKKKAGAASSGKNAVMSFSTKQPLVEYTKTPLLSSGDKGQNKSGTGKAASSATMTEAQFKSGCKSSGGTLGTDKSGNVTCKVAGTKTTLDSKGNMYTEYVATKSGSSGSGSGALLLGLGIFGALLLWS